jgi:hypothetical protein
MYQRRSKFLSSCPAQLIVNEVYGQSFKQALCRFPVLAKLRLDTPFRGIVPHLQPQLIVNPSSLFVID